MKREDFNVLPPAMQLKVLSRIVLDGESLAGINVGKKPLPPKYDARIGRQGGFQWASETSLEGLTYWRGKALQGAERGGEWADKDAKRAKDLERWIAYREWFPSEPWRGERFDSAVIAAPPVDKPRIYEYEARGNQPRRQQQNQTPPPSGDDDDDVPFA